MMASMSNRKRSNSVPALKLYKTIPGYSNATYEDGKKKLIDALKSRELLLSYLYKSNKDRQRYMAESAPKVFKRHRRRDESNNYKDNILPKSPLLHALKKQSKNKSRSRRKKYKTESIANDSISSRLINICIQEDFTNK